MLTGMHEPIRSIFSLSFLFFSFSTEHVLRLLFCILFSFSLYVQFLLNDQRSPLLLILTSPHLRVCSSSCLFFSAYLNHVCFFFSVSLLVSCLFVFIPSSEKIFSYLYPVCSILAYGLDLRRHNLCSIFFFTFLPVQKLAKKLNLPQPRISLIKEHVLKKGLASHDQQVSSS